MVFIIVVTEQNKEISHTQYEAKFLADNFLLRFITNVCGLIEIRIELRACVCIYIYARRIISFRIV
jgi:hypothetical protein